MQNYLLTSLILLPVVGAATALVYSFTPGARESHHRWIALGFTTAAFIVSLLLLKGTGGGVGGFQFEQNYSWIGSIGARYHVGVDGISLWLVLLTTLLMPISILSSWTAIAKRQPDLAQSELRDHLSRSLAFSDELRIRFPGYFKE